MNLIMAIGADLDDIAEDVAFFSYDSVDAPGFGSFVAANSTGQRSQQSSQWHSIPAHDAIRSAFCVPNVRSQSALAFELDKDAGILSSLEFTVPASIHDGTGLSRGLSALFANAGHFVSSLQLAPALATACRSIVPTTGKRLTTFLTVALRLTHLGQVTRAANAVAAPGWVATFADGGGGPSSRLVGYYRPPLFTLHSTVLSEVPQ